MADSIQLLLAHCPSQQDYFGMPVAVALRVGANIFGAAYTVICNKVIDKLADRFMVRQSAEA